MYRVILTAVLIAASSPAQAGDCAALGLDEERLTELFCAELKAVGAGPATSRGLGDSGTADTEAPVLEKWADIDLIQDAYRQDPRKTLDLIRRIKDAGGLGAE